VINKTQHLGQQAGINLKAYLNKQLSNLAVCHKFTEVNQCLIFIQGRPLKRVILMYLDKKWRAHFAVINLVFFTI
jgi:hypothetical protein